MLFARRSWQRADGIYHAMLARGFHGRFVPSSIGLFPRGRRVVLRRISRRLPVLACGWRLVRESR